MVKSYVFFVLVCLKVLASAVLSVQMYDSGGHSVKAEKRSSLLVLARLRRKWTTFTRLTARRDLWRPLRSHPPASTAVSVRGADRHWLLLIKGEWMLNSVRYQWLLLYHTELIFRVLLAITCSWSPKYIADFVKSVQFSRRATVRRVMNRKCRSILHTYRTSMSQIISFHD